MWTKLCMKLHRPLQFKIQGWQSRLMFICTLITYLLISLKSPLVLLSAMLLSFTLTTNSTFNSGCWSAFAMKECICSLLIKNGWRTSSFSPLYSLGSPITHHLPLLNDLQCSLSYGLENFSNGFSLPVNTSTQHFPSNRIFAIALVSSSRGSSHFLIPQQNTFFGQLHGSQPAPYLGPPT